ncbi:hypothetical protein [Pradoshia sp.]
MNKKLSWSLFILALIAVNIFAIPFAIWSTFAGTEEMKYLWIIGGFILWILLNGGVIQLAAAIKKEQAPFFWTGLSLVILQIVAMYLLKSFIVSDTWVIFMILGTMIASIVLLIIQVFTKKTSR